MELLATGGIFISGTTFKVVELGAGSTQRQGEKLKGDGTSPSRVISPQGYDPDSSYEPFTEPEPEDDDILDATHTDVFEELFGYRRKAGAPRSTDPNFLAIREGRTGVAVPRDTHAHAKGEGPAKASKSRNTKALLDEITVQDLLEQGFFQPGLDNVTVKCKKLLFTASLSRDGEIVYDGKLFRDPGDFSHYIKKQHLHERPGGNGWRSVHVDGVRLEDWRVRMLGDSPPASRPAAPAGRPPVPAARPPAPAGRSAGKKRRLRKGRAPTSENQDLSGEEAEEEEEAAAAAPAGTNNWVQCSSCSQWRVVPDSQWAMIEASDSQEWQCKAATWDVTQYEPFTPVCGRA